MVDVMTNCPRCCATLSKSTTLIPGHTVNRCERCNIFNVEGSPHWPTEHAGLQEQLLQFAAEIEETQNRVREFLDSDDNDPRWS
jgi:hypothetical protein